MTAKFQFSSEEDEKLIENVANYPFLYNICDENYKNHELKENVWKEISYELKRTAADCKKRWRNIRDTFMKIKRGNKQGRGSTAKPKSKWPLLQQLGFLDNVTSERSNSNMDDLQEDSENSIEEKVSIETSTIVSTTPYVPPLRKRKLHHTQNTNVTKKFKHEITKILNLLEKRALERQTLIENINKIVVEDTDPVCTFFKSMAMTVKTFPPHLIAEAKYRVFEIINELEKKPLEQ
ncbi:hypothetical protein K0M31_006670 [Melipona bicolor]|uniref:Transcription factor Adf-1 n=1 Tax=Melipona bicolor TaxID=60889 RepID=A0AA40FSA4_9HYME|nr:hypothetical protein K0M31_006670 [Melipona bicolor]